MPDNTHFTQTQIGTNRQPTQPQRDYLHGQCQITEDDVWTLIDPVKPDHLDSLGNGIYEARWWKPVPIMDVELLGYTEGVIIQDRPYEPDTLPGGIAVRFLINIYPAL